MLGYIADMERLLRVIDDGLKNKGYSDAKASRLAMGNPSTIKNIRLGRKPGFEAVEKLFRVLDIDMHYGIGTPELEGPSTVPLVGCAGAGGSVAYNGQLHDGETALAPPGTAEGLVAIEVRGDSATPFLHEGDRIYIRPDYPANPINHIGQFVLATATDGAAWIKILLNGNTTGLWNLHSTNPLCSLMEDVELDHVSPLVWVHFKRQNRLVKRDN